MITRPQQPRPRTGPPPAVGWQQALAVWRPGTGVVYQNPGLAEDLALDPAVLPSDDLQPYLTAVDADWHDALVRAVQVHRASQREPVFLTTKLLVADGVGQLVSVSPTVTRDVAGRVVEVSLVFTALDGDTANPGLGLPEAQLRRILEERTSAAAVLHSLGSGRELAATSHTRLFGRQEGHPEPSRALGLAHPDDRPAVLAAIAVIYDVHSTAVFTARVRHQEGHHLSMELRSRLVAGTLGAGSYVIPLRRCGGGRAGPGPGWHGSAPGPRRLRHRLFQHHAPADDARRHRQARPGLGRCRGHRDHQIVRYLVGLAHELDMITVCEGIETQSQLDQAIAAGSELCQGYLLGRPEIWDGRGAPPGAGQ